MSDTKFKIPKSLIDALDAGEVVPFVGAGVSMTVKKKNDDGTESSESLFPSWKGFVEILAEALRREHKPKEADFVLSSINIKKPKYLDALQHAQEELGESLWYKLFDESFNIPENKAHPDSLKLNKLVWKLSNNLIITTNVDRVFQWTCPQQSEFTILDVQNVEYAQLQNEKIPKDPTVWYLHGHIKHKEKVIFTREQFEAFYKEKGNEAKLQTLLSFLIQRTFLFIGFSLDDDYLRELLEYVHNLYKGGADSFYILFRERDIAAANFPAYVKPIPFSEFGEPLEDLVEELARIAKGGDDDGNDDSGDDKPNPPPKSDSDTKKPFFNVQYNSKGKEFVGRVGKIEEIWNLLNQEGCASIGQAVSVRGLGGFGKTQLAVEYAHAKKGEYKNGVFWVVADESIDNQLLQIADRQGWINQYDKTVNQLDVAKAKFLQLSDCLILFDNVETYAGIKDYLPKLNSQTHILITTREPQPAFKQIDLDLLERNESRELLLKISNRNSQDETEKEYLEKILEMLGDIPLAIELVGGYLAEHETVTFAKYHQYLDEVPLDQLEKEFPEGSFTNHDRSIIQTLRISEKIIKEKPLMVEILKVLAWSGSSSMGVSLLKALIEAENEFEFDTALGDAHKLRLLKKDEKSERYAIHRLLAKVIQYEEPLEKQNEWLVKVVKNLKNWFEEQKKQFKYLTEFEAETEHLSEWQKYIVNYLPEESVWLVLLENYLYWRRGDSQKALKLLKKSLNLYESKAVNNNELLAHIQNELGITYGGLGDYPKALEYQEKALELHKELFGEKHRETASSYGNVGTAYGDLGNYPKALEYQDKALLLHKELFGEKHPDTAISYGNVGSTYGYLGNHTKALEYQEKALELDIELFGEKHPDTATSYNNVGSTYGKLGNYPKALEYHYKVLELRRELFGEKHPDMASSYNNVGSMYGKLGNYPKALEYGEKALLLHKELFGEKHPVTAIYLGNIGGTFGDLDNHLKALEHKQKALELHQELLGNQHPNTIIFAGNLINTYIELGSKDKAGKIAIEFFKYVPQNHPNWKLFEEFSRPYRKKKNRHKKH